MTTTDTAIVIGKIHAHFNAEQFLSRSNKWFTTVEHLAERDGGYDCQLCKRKIERVDEITIDHIVPSSKGGSNAFSNKQLTHKKCNGRKGSTENLSIEFFINPPIKKERFKRIKKEWTDEHSNPEYWRIVNAELKTSVKASTDGKPVNWVAELYNEIVHNKFKNLSYVRFEQYFKNYAAQVNEKI